MTSITADLEAAEKLRLEANEYMRKQDYVTAINLHTEAISKNPISAKYYIDRSAAYLQAECYKYALEDAEKGVQLDKSNVKGYYQRAEALLALERHEEALKDYEFVIKNTSEKEELRSKSLIGHRMITRILQPNATFNADEDVKKLIDKSEVQTVQPKAMGDNPYATPYHQTAPLQAGIAPTQAPPQENSSRNKCWACLECCACATQVLECILLVCTCIASCAK